jgi:hypothetical protein
MLRVQHVIAEATQFTSFLFEIRVFVNQNLRLRFLSDFIVLFRNKRTNDLSILAQTQMTFDSLKPFRIVTAKVEPYGNSLLFIH